MRLNRNLIAQTFVLTMLMGFSGYAKLIKLDSDLSVANRDPWAFAQFIEKEENLTIGGVYFSNPFLLTASDVHHESDLFVERARIDASRG